MTEVVLPPNQVLMNVSFHNLLQDFIALVEHLSSETALFITRTLTVVKQCRVMVRIHNTKTLLLCLLAELILIMDEIAPKVGHIEL